MWICIHLSTSMSWCILKRTSETIFAEEARSWTEKAQTIEGRRFTRSSRGGRKIIIISRGKKGGERRKSNLSNSVSCFFCHNCPCWICWWDRFAKLYNVSRFFWNIWGILFVGSMRRDCKTICAWWMQVYSSPSRILNKHMRKTLQIPLSIQGQLRSQKTKHNQRCSQLKILKVWLWMACFLFAAQGHWRI